jgi:hypothetical protein
MIRRIVALTVCFAALIGLPVLADEYYSQFLCCDCASWEQSGVNNCNGLMNYCFYSGHYIPEFCNLMYDECVSQCPDEIPGWPNPCWADFCYSDCYNCDK